LFVQPLFILRLVCVFSGFILLSFFFFATRTFSALRVGRAGGRSGGGSQEKKRYKNNRFQQCSTSQHFCVISRVVFFFLLN
jgi:hypothetical protein